MAAGLFKSALSEARWRRRQRWWWWLFPFGKAFFVVFFPGIMTFQLD